MRTLSHLLHRPWLIAQTPARYRISPLSGSALAALCKTSKASSKLRHQERGGGEDEEDEEVQEVDGRVTGERMVKIMGTHTRTTAAVYDDM